MFEKEDLIAEILDVFYIERPKNRSNAARRPFHVLSRRLTGNAVFYQKNKQYPVSPASLLYIPSDVAYSQESDGEETLIAIHLNILNYGSKSLAVSENPSEKVTALFLKIYELWSSKCQNYKYLCTALLYELFAEISHGKEDQYKDYPFLKKSVDYINENYKEPIGVGSLADMSGVSENYYRRVFGRCMGLSPLKYINAKRIDAAKALIVSGYYRMAEVSEMCGFSEHKYFCSVFKKETGMTPSDYAKCFEREKQKQAVGDGGDKDQWKKGE